MKLTLDHRPQCGETEIKVIYEMMDPHLNRLIEQIRLYTSAISLEHDGITSLVSLDDIFYFDTVDNKTFAYLSQGVYSCSFRLYELEEILVETPFVRISKNCILNTNVVCSVRAQFSGRLEILLANGEKNVVSKHYLKAFRKKIEEGLRR